MRIGKMKRTNKIIIGIAASLLCAGTLMGQKAERERIREGNKLYNKEQYTDAEIAYRKGVEVNPRSFEGAYDMGNALYKQQKYPEAAEQYKIVASQSTRLLSENPDNVLRLAQVFHNMGNISMQGKEYDKSIEAYKQSLRLNPSDDETRYNLALAQKLRENQENQEDQQDQQQDQNEQKQDQQDQPQDDQNQQQQPPEQQEEQQETPPQNSNMSKENAQQILDAFLQDEKDTQEKVKQAQERQKERRKTDKEW